VEGEWVAALLPKFSGIDVDRLSGGRTAQLAKQAADTAATQAAHAAGGEAAVPTAGADRRSTQADVDAARARYLARKARRGK
jgi:hypothetical protein